MCHSRCAEKGEWSFSSLLHDYSLWSYQSFLAATTQHTAGSQGAKAAIFPILFCHIDPHHSCQGVVSLYQETKASPKLLHLCLLPGCALVLDTAVVFVRHSVREPLHLRQFSLPLPSHTPLWDGASQASQEAERIFPQFYRGLDAVSAQLLSSVL